MSYGNVFDMSYFNPNNNINDWAINRTDFFDRIISDYNGSKTTWWPMHRNYVRKILDSIGNKGNVLIDLANEAGTGSFHCYEWVEKTIDIIEEWENENGIDILIGMDEHFWFRVPGKTTWVRDHSRLEVLTGHGKTDVMHEAGYDSSMGYSPHDIGKLRMDYHKPAVSIHNGSGAKNKEADWQKHYQWLALMQKCQGAASYGYGTWLEDSAQRKKFEQQTGYLLGFFNTLMDYTSLIVSNEKIVSAPGYSKYKYLLSSSQEAVFYTHNYGYGTTTSAGQTLSLQNLKFTDGNVNITFLHPENGSTSSSTGKVSGGSITITLPSFYEDITVYMLQAKLTPTQNLRVE